MSEKDCIQADQKLQIRVNMSHLSNYCDIYLVRHGETDWNVARRIQGHLNIPLNQNGKKQAKNLQSILKAVSFSAAFSSDLMRAKETAEIIALPHALSIHEAPALRERHFGQLEGIMINELDYYHQQAFPILKTLPKHEYLSYKWHPEIETSAEIYHRVSHYLHDVIPSFLGKAILVVSHSGVLRSILDQFDFTPNHKWIITNCGFLKIQATTDEWLIEARIGVSSKPFYAENSNVSFCQRESSQF